MIKKIISIFLFLFIPFLSANCAEEQIILPSQTGKVLNVNYVDTENEYAPTKQVVKVKLISGPDKGNIIDIDNVMSGNPYYDINVKPNTKLILHAEYGESGTEYSIQDIKRSETVLWLSLLFCGLLVFVGKKKGLCSLISIVLTVLIITHCLSPLILKGFNPILTAIAACILSTATTMYLVGGFNSKSTSASIGATLSLIFAGLLSLITMQTANLTGFIGEHTMFLYSVHPELNFVDLAVSSIILATLGAVMDVAMSIASTINEIHITDKTKTVRELFQSGMNVGRDIIGTMANTLILVYLGGSLPLLLLASNIDLQKFINLNQVVTEISSALIGSISIVICVPFTAFISAVLISKYTVKKEKEIIDIKIAKS